MPVRSTQQQYHVPQYLQWLDNCPTATVYHWVTQLDLAVAFIKLLTVEEGKGSPARMTSMIFSSHFWCHFLIPTRNNSQNHQIYIYIKHDSNQVSSQLFRHVWLRHLTLWETCPAFSETFSPTSGVRVMVRSCPEVRQQPLRRFVGQLDRALQEADGDPHPGDIWRHLATWRLAMVLIFHDESNKCNKCNEPRYTKMLLHEKNVASC